MSSANRGKVAEDLLKKKFKAIEANDASFTYERIYDARSSMGKMSNPRVGDFALYHRGTNTVVEVKEVQHDYRLPCANFSLDQRARMRKRLLAGSKCYVVVYHSTTKKFRILCLDYFGTQDAGSWNLIAEKERTLDEVIGVLYAGKFSNLVSISEPAGE